MPFELSRGDKIAFSIIGGYLLGIWLTIGFLSAQYTQCAAQLPGYLRWRECGGPIEIGVQSILWPIYWFAKTAIWTFT